MLCMKGIIFFLFLKFRGIIIINFYDDMKLKYGEEDFGFILVI